LAVNKQATRKFYVENFNRRKLNELEVMKQCRVEISNSFEALENLNGREDIEKAWENIKEKKNSVIEIIGPYESKQHKPCVI
jgi:hypothetical protein